MAKPRMDLSAFVGKLLEEQDGDVLREGIRVLSQALMETEGGRPDRRRAARARGKLGLTTLRPTSWPRPIRRAYIFTFRIADTASREGGFWCDLLAKTSPTRWVTSCSRRPVIRKRESCVPRSSSARVPPFSAEQSEALRGALAAMSAGN
jgi:hypothetical protein